MWFFNVIDTVDIRQPDEDISLSGSVNNAMKYIARERSLSLSLTESYWCNKICLSASTGQNQFNNDIWLKNQLNFDIGMSESVHECLTSIMSQLINAIFTIWSIHQWHATTTISSPVRTFYSNQLIKLALESVHQWHMSVIIGSPMTSVC